jgi:hypothetical protein
MLFSSRLKDIVVTAVKTRVMAAKKANASKKDSWGFEGGG